MNVTRLPLPVVAASALVALLSTAGATLYAAYPAATLILAVTALLCSGLRIVYNDREYESVHTMLLFLCFWYGGLASGLMSVFILAAGSVLGVRGSLNAGRFHIATAAQALVLLPLAALYPRGSGMYPSPVYLLTVPLLFMARKLTATGPEPLKWRSLAFLGFLANVPAVLLAIHLTETFGTLATLLLCMLCVLYIFLIRRETDEMGRRSVRLSRLTEYNMISRSLLSAASMNDFVAAIETRTGPGLAFYERVPDGWVEWTSKGCGRSAPPSESVPGLLAFSSSTVPGLRIAAKGEAARSISALFREEVNDFGEQIARTWQVVSARIHQEDTLFGVALLLARIADLKDRYTKMHSLRVAEISTAIGSRLGLSGSELSMLRTGALLHDIGKVSLPPEILGKRGILTSRERSVIKGHPGEGSTLVSGLSRYRKAAETVLHHHERLDGSGYPTGLRGSEIPLHSRIVAVADTFDAITADRPYHPEEQSENALREIQAGRGTLYDARVVDALSGLVAEGAL